MKFPPYPAVESPNRPVRKLEAASIAGALAVVLTWMVGLTGVDMPEEVASALTVLMMALVAYFTQERQPF